MNSGTIVSLALAMSTDAFTAAVGNARLAVFIDYRLPACGFAHGLGLVFGRVYAAWCTRRMATDAVAAAAGIVAATLNGAGTAGMSRATAMAAIKSDAAHRLRPGER